jgi:hypothetical protein
LPYPGVDLTILRPRTGDVYPLSLIEFIKQDRDGNKTDINNNAFCKPYKDVLGMNWESGDYSYDDRLFTSFTAIDQFEHSHLLPTFLSKITNPDQSVIKFNEEGNPIDGIRTFAECAHYTRCIPFCEERPNDFMMWCSPDFTVTRKIGTEEDHALLMASLMRTVKYENVQEFNKWAAKAKEETKSKKDDRKKEILKLAADGQAAEDDESMTAIPDGDSDDNREKEVVDSIDDRVFVCLAKAAEGSEKKREAWVMTIDKNYQTVTFWEVKGHKQYVLKGRILKEEREFMQHYLCPVLTEEEKRAFQAEREEARESLLTMGDDDKASNHDPGAKDFRAPKETDGDDDDDDDDSDVEKSDSDFQDRFDNIINYDDIDQGLKGDNINFIG